MPTVHHHAAARRNLVEQFVYLGEEAGLDTAERFLTHAESRVSSTSPASR